MITKFIKTIRDLFRPHDDRDRAEFERLQVVITGDFVDAEELRRRLYHAEERQRTSESEASSFRKANQEWVGNGWFEHDHEKPGYFQLAKWLAVVLEAVLSMAVADLILRSTVGADLSQRPFLLKLIVTGGLAFVLLRIGMFFRTLGKIWMTKGKDTALARAMFILPLILIPTLAGVIALMTESGGGLQLALAVFSLALNLIVANMADDFEDARKGATARGRLNEFESTARRAVDDRNSINESIRAIRRRITLNAMELRAAYNRLQERGMTPTFSLSLPARYAINRWVFFEDILPLPHNPRLTIPPKELDQLSRFWSEDEVPRRVPEGGEVTPLDPMRIEPTAPEEPDVNTDSNQEGGAGLDQNDNPAGLDDDNVPPGDKYL